MASPRCYLFDASALVAFLLKSSGREAAAAKQKILKLVAPRRGKHRPDLFVPNFCMAECSSALAKIFLEEDCSEENEAAYRQHIEMLLDWVSSKKRHVIRTYKLKRQHLVNIESVFVADRRLPRRKGKPLSGLDGAIIAMGRVLMRAYDTVVVLTTDQRMVDVCAQNRDSFPHAINLESQEIPGI